MKAVVLFVIFTNLLFIMTSCYSTSTVQQSKSDEIETKVFDITGKWIIQDVVFVGNPNDVEFSKEINLYSLFGSTWKETKGKYFVFESNNHWKSTILEKEISQKDFTYEFTDNLILILKGKELNYQFSVIIKDSTINSMTWDIGNNVDLVLERVN